MFRSFSAGLLLILLVAGCAGTTRTAKRDNFAQMYGPGGAALELDARVHHVTTEHSILYFKLNTRDLLYKSDGTGGPFRAMVRLTYETYTDWSARTLIDSASTLLQDRSTDTAGDKELIGSMEIHRKDDRSFVLKVTARDLNRESQNSVFIRVERDPEGTRQYFLPIDPTTSAPLFTDHFEPGQDLELKSEVLAGRTLQGTYRVSDGSLPMPVFTTAGNAKRSLEADSIFEVPFNEEGNAMLQLHRPGTYHLGTDSTGSGYTLFVLDQAFPYVGTHADMLRPLRYITSMQEFDRISTAEDLRSAIERFWLDAAGDRDRAREAIRIFYARVENANRHFTSHVEGWRTDRGLVHIIFGTPNTIYKSDLTETWIYGEENNLMSLTFNFTRRTGAFTDNDLVLERDPMLKGAWYRNVESWRNGRVYQN